MRGLETVPRKPFVLALTGQHLDAPATLLAHGAPPLRAPASGSDALDLVMRAPQLAGLRLLLDARPNFVTNLADRRASGPAAVDIARWVRARGASRWSLSRGAYRAAAHGDGVAPVAYMEHRSVALAAEDADTLQSALTLVGVAAHPGRREVAAALLDR